MLCWLECLDGIEIPVTFDGPTAAVATQAAKAESNKAKTEGTQKDEKIEYINKQLIECNMRYVHLEKSYKEFTN